MLTPIHDTDATGKTVKLFRREYAWAVCVFTDGTYVALRATGDDGDYCIEVLSTIDDVMDIGEDYAVELGLITKQEHDERIEKWERERAARDEKWEREQLAKLKAKYESAEERIVE